MLARFMHVDPGERVLDAGCGTGYLSLYAGWNYPDCGGIIGIDIVPDWIERANENLALLKNLLDTPLPPIHFTVEDAKSESVSEDPFDVLVSNPPFFPFNSSRASISSERRIARQDVELTVPALFDCARKRLRTGGRLYFVIPTQRLDESRNCATQRCFEIAGVETDRSIRKRSGGVCLVHMVL